MPVDFVQQRNNLLNSISAMVVEVSYREGLNNPYRTMDFDRMNHLELSRVYGELAERSYDPSEGGD